MRFQISHTTRFEYERPAYDSHNELRLHPWDSALQHCEHFALETTPSAAVVAYRDFFGNYGHALSVSAPHDSLTIVARSEVEISAPASADYPEVPFSRFLSDDS